MAVNVSVTIAPDLELKLNRAVGVWMGRIVREAEHEAVSEAPVGKPDPLGRPPKGPHMRDTIRGYVRDGVGVVEVRSSHFLPVHEGSRPHPIRPRRHGYPLRFWWDKVGGEFRTMRVSHPGTEPNPFLVRALRRVLSRLR